MTVSEFAPTSAFLDSTSIVDQTSQFDVDIETFDQNVRTIHGIEARWRLPAIPDVVKVDLASMPGVTAESLTGLLNGLDGDINGEDEPSQPDPAINYQVPLLDPSFGRSGFDQFRVIAAGVTQRPAPIDPTRDAVKLFKQKAIKEGYLEVPDGTVLDSTWSPEFNSIRYEMAQDDYDQALRGNRYGAVPVTGENGVIKQLDKWTSPGGLLAAATELDLWWDGGAISKEFSTWGDKWRKLTKSENPWDFAKNLVDAVTGPIDDVVFPVVNWALIGTGVGAVGNSARVGWLASKAGNGSKFWQTMHGGSRILNPVAGGNWNAIGQRSMTSGRLLRGVEPGTKWATLMDTAAGPGQKVTRTLGRGMEAWRGYTPVKVTKSALQVPMRMGFISQAEDLFPGYGGQGASLGDIPGVKSLADAARSTTADPRFLPVELAFTPYNIFSRGTFLRSAGEGAGLLSGAADLAKRAGTPGGRAVVGATAGAVVGGITGDDAGDIAESAGLGALSGLVLPSVGRALASPSGRVIGSSALGALAGTGIAAVSDEDLSDGLMVGAVSGLGLVGANSVWAKVPNPGRWVGHIGTGLSRLDLKPLTDHTEVTAAAHRGMRARLEGEELRIYDEAVQQNGSVIQGWARMLGTDEEGARHALAFYLVLAGVDNTARIQAGISEVGPLRGQLDRYYLNRHKLTSQIRKFDLDDLSSQTLDDIATAMVIDQAGTRREFNRLAQRMRTELAKDPEKALTFARLHNENAHETMRQLMSIDNLGLVDEQVDVAEGFGEASRNFVPTWNRKDPADKLGAFESYIAQTKNSPFGHWGEFYEATEGLQRGMVNGWFDEAQFLPGTNRWGQPQGPGVEIAELTKGNKEANAAITDALVRMPTKDLPKALKGNRFAPLARLAPFGRFTVMGMNTWAKQAKLSLADDVAHYLDTAERVRQLGRSDDHTTALGMIARHAETEGLGTLDDLDDAAWKHLIRITKNDAKTRKINEIRKFAAHRGMSLRDVETRLETAMDDLAHDPRMVEAGLDEVVRGAHGEGILRGSRALRARRKQLHESARFTAAEIDANALKASVRQTHPDAAQEVDEILDGLTERGYKLVYGVEFLSPHDIAHSNAWGFADMGTRELNFMTAGNFFRGKLPAIRRMDEERRRRTALANALSEINDPELGDVTPDSLTVSNALDDLTRVVMRPLQDDHMRLMEDLHTMGFWEKKGVGIRSLSVPTRLEDLQHRPKLVIEKLTGAGWTEAQADAIARSIPMFRQTNFSDLGFYSFEARARQRNELVQALKFLSGSKQGHAWQVLGGAAGAVAGANQDPDATGLERIGQAVVGAGVGAAAGTAVRAGVRGATSGVDWTDLERRAARKDAFYLGDKYVRLRDNLRFGLSPFFDMSRWTEGLLLAQTAAPLRKTDGTRLTLPLNMTPRGLRNRIAMEIRAQRAKDELPALSDFELKGQARAEFNQLRNDFNKAARGDYDPEILDSTGKWFSSIGIMGFNPTDWKATAYGNLRRADPNLTSEQAYTAAREMYDYSTRGRSAAELSVNFIFFPFSFQKKALGHIGKWMHDDLSRSLIIHDAFKTYEILDERWNLDAYWRDHLPALKQLNKLNLLAFGLSPGRFGGINAELFGSAYRASLAMFMPWGGSVTNPLEAAELQRVVRQLAPAYNDINWMMKQVQENGYKGTFSPIHQTRAAEISDGYGEWNAYKSELDQFLREKNMTWSDMFNKPWAADVKARYERKKFEIADRYPAWLEARREHVSNQTLLEMERNDRIAYATQDPRVQPVLGIRETAGFANYLRGLPQRQVDDLMLAWFDNQVTWVKEQLAAQGISVGDADGWVAAPPEAAGYLLTRSVELRNLNPRWFGLWQKFWLRELGPIEAPT